jgi:adenine/guanine phosphoribosyltransferase-like PRPP-binding protein
VINPILDVIPQVNPELLENVIENISNVIIDKNKIFDKIVTIESMGVSVTIGLSLKLKKPYTIIRKKPYNLPKESAIRQKKDILTINYL